MGITNELFPNERGYPPTPLPASCLINPTPEDGTNFDATSTTGVPSDIIAFSNFMRFLDQPALRLHGGALLSAPSKMGATFLSMSQNAPSCHTPTMTTGPAYVAALSGVNANLFSDLLVHNMGIGAFRWSHTRRGRAG